MKRLLIWNLLLAVCATAGIYELRRVWMDTRAQEDAVLLRKTKAPKVDVPAPPAKPAPFQAISYNDVAQKMLFSKDRNPNLEPPPPPPLPPPPPPMPALPHLYGVLGLPTGAVAIMSEKGGGPQKKIRVGDPIGEFKIAKLDTERITLDWKGKLVEKTIDEMLDRTVVAAAADAGPARAALAAPPPPSGPPGMGVEIGASGQKSVRACLDQTTETSPPGTVLEGYVKTSRPTPFGPACRWEQQ